MKTPTQKLALRFVLAGTIVLSPLAVDFAAAPNTAHAAITTSTTEIVSFHDAIYKKLTASDITDIRAAYSNTSKINSSTISSIIGASLVDKIDSKTSEGTAANLAADLAKVLYKTNTTEFKTALNTFKKDHEADFTKIFEGELSVDQAISLFTAFEKNLESKLVSSFINNEHTSFDTIVKETVDMTLAQKEFKGFDSLFSQKLGVSVNDLLLLKTKVEAVTDPNKAASAAFSSGLIRSEGGDIYGSGTIYLGTTAPVYSFKISYFGIVKDLSGSIVWKTNNSSIAAFSGNKLIAKKVGIVKVQAYYLNMPIITKDVTIKSDTTAPTVPYVSPFSNKDHTIQGKAEASSFIIVKSGKTTVAYGYTNSKGTFSLKINFKKTDTYLTVTAKDAAGNVSKAKTIKVLDKIAPSKPIVYSVDNNDKVIKGKAEAYSTITVYKGSKVLAVSKASSKGNFSVKIKAQKKGTVLYVTSKDMSKNISTRTKVTVKTVKK